MGFTVILDILSRKNYDRAHAAYGCADTDDNAWHLTDKPRYAPKQHACGDKDDCDT